MIQHDMRWWYDRIWYCHLWFMIYDFDFWCVIYDMIWYDTIWYDIVAKPNRMDSTSGRSAFRNGSTQTQINTEMFAQVIIVRTRVVGRTEVTFPKTQVIWVEAPFVFFLWFFHPSHLAFICLQCSEVCRSCDFQQMLGSCWDVWLSQIYRWKNPCHLEKILCVFHKNSLDMCDRLFAGPFFGPFFAAPKTSDRIFRAHLHMIICSRKNVKCFRQAEDWQEPGTVGIWTLRRLLSQVAATQQQKFTKNCSLKRYPPEV